MLNVIFGRENVPGKFILDTRVYFRRYSNTFDFYDPFIQSVISGIDKAEVIANGAIKDYRGLFLSVDKLSTGSKTLCSIYFDKEGRTGALEGEITIDVTISNPNYKFSQETGASIEAVLGRTDEKYVIMIDEYSILSGEIIGKARKSDHVFLCVTRAMPWRLSYPLQGLYIVSRSLSEGSELSFDLNHYNGLPLLKDISNSFDYIVTEASLNHSEQELLSLYFSNLIPACGRDKINRVLVKLCKENPNCKILVFADLGNIGQAVHILEQKVKENPNIVFYDYMCFEQLLHESKLVKSLGKKSNIDRFSVLSLEEYFQRD